jgi:cellulose synthase/poly-beta-1,6-N-acetylglucosamine synthase-like glycosyltransferase
MSAFESLILGLYFFVLVILGVYGWHRYYLVYAYMKNKDKVPGPPPAWDGPLPPVTIQLPIFNEMYVVDRLLQATARIDYPRELMEIQVLDDSTDETTEVARHAVDRLCLGGAAVPRRGGSSERRPRCLIAGVTFTNPAETPRLCVLSSPPLLLPMR